MYSIYSVLYVHVVKTFAHISYFLHVYFNKWYASFLWCVQVNFRCDPLVNFKLKQRLVVLGACVTLGIPITHAFPFVHRYKELAAIYSSTSVQYSWHVYIIMVHSLLISPLCFSLLGMDYLSDIAQWRSYCAVEDAFVQGMCRYMCFVKYYCLSLKGAHNDSSYFWLYLWLLKYLLFFRAI